MTITGRGLTTDRIKALIDASHTPAIRMNRNLTAEEMGKLETYEYLSRMAVWRPSGRVVQYVNRLWKEILSKGRERNE